MSGGIGQTWPSDARNGTIGVEEEFFLVDPESGDPVPCIEGVLAAGATATREFVQELVEGCTDVCHSGEEVLAGLVELRADLARGAQAHDATLAGFGAHPCAAPEELLLTESERYDEMSASMPWTWREATTCGMHVHVGVDDPDEAIRVCDRLRGALPVLLALSANSPLWRGERTGLMSVRTVLRRLQPRTGIPPRHGSWAAFSRRMAALQEAGVPDGSWTWWAVRPHATHGTVEVRAFDTQTDVRNAHAFAMLTAALVEHLRQPGVVAPFAVDDDVLLEENWWNAMRDGVAGTHVVGDATAGYDVRTIATSAFELIALLEPALPDEVVARLRALALHSEADQQLRDFERGGCAHVVRSAAARTMESCLQAYSIEPGVHIGAGVAAGGAHGLTEEMA